MTPDVTRMPPHRAILEIRGGPLACRKAILSPGQTLRVGRTTPADCPVPHDRRMSGLQFSLTWDAERCHLSHLSRATGTYLEGQPTQEAEVSSGDWIRAGGTDFLVYFEAHTPPPLDVDLTLLHDQKRQVLSALRQEPGPLYAVLDSAVDRRVLQLIRESIDPHRSLYDGLKGDTLANVAPYLVALRRDSGLLERLVTEGLGRRWGIFLSSQERFDEVRRHLRRFLMVEDRDTREAYYFRYYDPRTLPTFLRTCTVRQYSIFFGASREVSVFLAENERGDLLRFSTPYPDPVREPHADSPA